MLYRQFVLEWKLYSRDRVALFWTFAFPMFLLLGFGTIFRNGSSPAASLVVVQGTGNTPDGRALLAALARTPLKLLPLERQAAETRWLKGDSAAQLEPSGDGFSLRVNSYLAAQGQTAVQAVQQASLMLQVRQGGREPRILPVGMTSPGGGHAMNYASYLLPGLMGMNLLSMGLFNVGMVIVNYREKGKYRRLAVTPLPKWVFLLGQVLHRLSLTVLQSTLMLTVGHCVFGISNQGSYLLLAGVMALGTACFMTMGFALAGLADTSEGYSAFANACFFPMLFLSGVYFSIDTAPRWMQVAVVMLPLSPYLKALRAIFNDGATLAGHEAGLAVVLLWTIACFGLAVRRFRWT